MLNGKFYAGLPPKMSERSGGVRINRQESHLFWPDDTKTESAVETRVRRRTSLLLSEAEPRPVVGRREESRPEHEVDTRSLFKKEFANSSIQFYDNLQDDTTTKTTPRRRLLAKRQELTPKLTATKLVLPKQQAGDEAFTAENRKQAYNSKIEFNDFVNEPPSTRNNVRKPRLDMNDKRDVERNTKNSPKLQVKRNVRNLSLERELLPREKALNSTARPQSMAIDVSAHKPVNLDNSTKEPPAYRPPGDSRRTAPPKKILKHVSAPPGDDYGNDYGNELLHHDDHLENGFSELRIRGAPTLKKHVTYSDEAYDRPPYGYYERQRTRAPPPPLRQIRTYYPAAEDYEYAEADGGAYHDDEAHNHSYGSSLSHSHSHSQSLGRSVMPNMRTGNHGNQRQQQRTERQYMETSSDSAKMLNNSKNNHNNSSRNSNNLNNKMVNNNRESAASAAAAAAATTTNASSSSSSSTLTALAYEIEFAQCSEHDSSAADPRKHLRSSLCFSGDALMVDPTSEAAAASSTDTPTSAARRNARSSATKRVSVGLPD